MGSTYVEVAEELSVSDWLSELCFELTNLGLRPTALTPVYE